MKVKFNHNGVWVIGEHPVLPGMNDLLGFEKHMDHPDVQAKMKAISKVPGVEGLPVLEILEKGAARGIPVESKPIGLSALKEKEAIAAVEGCLNERDLNAWKEGEKRQKVLKAIDEQLKKFALGHRGEEKKEDGHKE